MNVGEFRAERHRLWDWYYAEILSALDSMVDYSAFLAAAKTLRKERAAKESEAWAKLSETYSTPLGVWVVEHCESRPFEALMVLSVLPATLAELDQVAKDFHWNCDAWEAYRALAIKAGVVSEYRK